MLCWDLGRNHTRRGLYVVLQDTVQTVARGGGMNLGAAASELARVDEHDVVVDDAPLGVWGLGFKVQRPRFKLQGLGFVVQGTRFGVRVLGCGGFKVGS